MKKSISHSVYKRRGVIFFCFLLFVVLGSWGICEARKINFRLSPEDSLVDKLVSLDISRDEALMVVAKVDRFIKRESIKSDWSFTLYYDDRGVPVTLTVPVDVGSELVVDLKKLEVKKKRLKIEVKEKRFFGMLQNGDSIFYKIYEQSGDATLAVKFAEIFSDIIDFYTWVRPGDYYAFICQVLEDEKGKSKYGNIIVAKYVGKVIRAEAAYYKGYYYDRNGRPLQGQFLATPISYRPFLKSPVRYKRISSKFSYKRLHPILGIVRPHLGVDYAAPEGTPVRSIADGVVVKMGWLGGYGKTIVIRHSRDVVSQYGHLKDYARGIYVGKRIKKGQIIGYVGKTGLATGPHLDFRVKVKGRFVNPLAFLRKLSRKRTVYVKVPLRKRLGPKALANISKLFEKLDSFMAKLESTSEG